MNYNKWLRAEDIPIIRRLDYICKYTDRFASGKLYAALRDLTYLKFYNSKEIEEETLKEDFRRSKSVILPELECVNSMALSLGIPIIFTNVNDFRKVGEDYIYFWELKTEDDFVREEAEARLEISDRLPVGHECGEYEKMIVALVNEIKLTGEVPERERILEIIRKFKD